MKKIVTLIQIGTAIGLIVFVLLQSQGTGLGGIAGGSQSYHSKKGIEKIIFIGTIVLAILFLLISIINILISQ